MPHHDVPSLLRGSSHAQRQFQAVYWPVEPLLGGVNLHRSATARVRGQRHQRMLPLNIPALALNRLALCAAPLPPLPGRERRANMMPGSGVAVPMEALASKRSAIRLKKCSLQLRVSCGQLRRWKADCN